MKRLIPFFLAFGMLLSLCGCRGSFGSMDLQDAIEIPEDGIVKESTIEQIKEKNAIASFYGESNGCKYEGCKAPYEKHTEHHADHQGNGAGRLLQTAQSQGAG